MKPSIEYPESVLAMLNLSPESFEQEARIALALKLLEMGRLTSGQAASLAQIPRVVFLVNCKQYRASSVIWDEDELKAEFREEKP